MRVLRARVSRGELIMSKRRGHAAEQIAAILKREEGGMKIVELRRQEGLAWNTQARHLLRLLLWQRLFA